MSMPYEPTQRNIPVPPNSYQGRCDDCFAKEYCGPADNFPSEHWSHMDPEIANQYVMTRSHPDLEVHMANIGSLDLTNFKGRQTPQDDWLLPRYIPKIIPSGSFPWGINFPTWTYGMSIHTLTQRSDLIIDRAWVPNIRSMMPEGSQIVLDYYAEDNNIDGLFDNYYRYKIKYWDNPIFKQFDAVFMPNFSMYLDDPQMTRWILMKRGLLVAQEMFKEGINVVPVLCFDNEENLRRNFEYIASNMGDIHTIGLQLHIIALDRMRVLAHKLELLYKYVSEYPFRFVINGLSSAWSIREVRRMFVDAGLENNFHFANLSPYMEMVRMDMPAAGKENYFKNQITKFTRWGDGLDLPKDGPIVRYPGTYTPEEMELKKW